MLHHLAWRGSPAAGTPPPPPAEEGQGGNSRQARGAEIDPSSQYYLDLLSTMERLGAPAAARCYGDYAGTPPSGPSGPLSPGPHLPTFYRPATPLGIAPHVYERGPPLPPGGLAGPCVQGAPGGLPPRAVPLLPSYDRGNGGGYDRGNGGGYERGNGNSPGGYGGAESGFEMSPPPPPPPPPLGVVESAPLFPVYGDRGFGGEVSPQRYGRREYRGPPKQGYRAGGQCSSPAESHYSTTTTQASSPRRPMNASSGSITPTPSSASRGRLGGGGQMRRSELAGWRTNSLYPMPKLSSDPPRLFLPVLKLRGLPFFCSRRHLLNWFGPWSAYIHRLTLVPDVEPFNSGFALVTMSCAAAALGAWANLHRARMTNRRFIEVFTLVPPHCPLLKRRGNGQSPGPLPEATANLLQLGPVCEFCGFLLCAHSDRGLNSIAASRMARVTGDTASSLMSIAVLQVPALLYQDSTPAAAVESSMFLPLQWRLSNVEQIQLWARRLRACHKHPFSTMPRDADVATYDLFSLDAAEEQAGLRSFLEKAYPYPSGSNVQDTDRSHRYFFDLANLDGFDLRSLLLEIACILTHEYMGAMPSPHMKASALKHAHLPPTRYLSLIELGSRLSVQARAYLFVVETKLQTVCERFPDLFAYRREPTFGCALNLSGTLTQGALERHPNEDICGALLLHLQDLPALELSRRHRKPPPEGLTRSSTPQQPSQYKPARGWEVARTPSWAARQDFAAAVAGAAEEATDDEDGAGGASAKPKAVDQGEPVQAPPDQPIQLGKSISATHHTPFWAASGFNDDAAARNPRQMLLPALDRFASDRFALPHGFEDDGTSLLPSPDRTMTANAMLLPSVRGEGSEGRKGSSSPKRPPPEPTSLGNFALRGGDSDRGGSPKKVGASGLLGLHRTVTEDPADSSSAFLMQVPMGASSGNYSFPYNAFISGSDPESSGSAGSQEARQAATGSGGVPSLEELIDSLVGKPSTRTPPHPTDAALWSSHAAGAADRSGGLSFFHSSSQDDLQRCSSSTVARGDGAGDGAAANRTRDSPSHWHQDHTP